MPQTLGLLNDERAFVETDAPMLVIDGALVIRAANPSYVALVGRSRESLIGMPLFEAFPDNPGDPRSTGVANLAASLQSVFRTGQQDRMALQRYDMRGPGQDDAFECRYWTMVNSPLHDSGRRVIGVLHHAEDVSAALGPVLDDPGPHLDALDAQSWQDLAAALVRETSAHLQARAQVSQLERALSSRIIIEQAKGVVMATLDIGAHEAFEILRQRARSSRTSLHGVCAEVVQTRQISQVTGEETGRTGS